MAHWNFRRFEETPSGLGDHQDCFSPLLLFVLFLFAFKYLRDEVDRKRAAPIDTSLVFDGYMLSTKVILTPQASEPICTSGPSTFSTHISTTAPPLTTSAAAIACRPPITQAMLYKIRHLAHFVDVHASRVVAAVSRMIEQPIAAALAPIRVEMIEHRELIYAHHLTLDALTMSGRFGRVEVHKFVDRESATVESEAELDEEELGVRDTTIYDDLADLEGVIVETVVQESLLDTLMMGSSGAKDDAQPSSDV
uniref:Polyprotein protein n=1 Tax=Solanum demissum TaxID=50514 RepID=Q6L3R0_SOLDE|nr:hypothetical protein SDM1_41t00021 [Solanum demissum]